MPRQKKKSAETKAKQQKQRHKRDKAKLAHLEAKLLSSLSPTTPLHNWKNGNSKDYEKLVTEVKDLKSEVFHLKSKFKSLLESEVKAAVDYFKIKRGDTSNVLRLLRIATQTHESHGRMYQKKIEMQALHKCNICKEEFYTLDVYQRHMVWHEMHSNPDLKGFKCPFCDMIFTVMYSMLRHLKRIHSKVKVICQSCNSIFKKMDDLAIHHHEEHYPVPSSMLEMLKSAVAKRHKVEANKRHPGVHKCSYCMETFPHIRIYTEHTLEHMKEENGCSSLVFNCPLCENQCSNIWGVVAHLQCHSNDRSDCSKCKETYEDTNSLLIHFYRIHFEAPKRITEYIVRIFSDSLQNPENMKRRNSNRSLFTCEICAASFFSETLYKTHISDHEVRRTERELRERRNTKPKLVHVKRNAVNRQNSHKEKLINRRVKKIFVNAICPVCDEECQSERGVRIHILNHSVAEISAIKSVSEDILSYVKSRITTDCTLCSEKFFQKSQLAKHILEFHEDDKELKDKFCFNCSLCDKYFSGEAQLRFHHLSHGVYCQCPICKENISTKELFITHINESHSGSNEKFIEYADGCLCKICGLRLDDTHRILKHINSVHSEKPFVCDVCGASFVHDRLLKHHQTNVHAEGSFVCHECGKQFKTEANLKYHTKRVHAGKNEPIPCKECDKIFSCTETYQNHYFAFHATEKPFKCNVCQKGFAAPSTLYLHKILKCGKSKAKVTTCPICDEVFENYLVMYHHKSNAHKYGCKGDFCHVCDKQFSNPFNLFTHNRNFHTGENGRKLKLSKFVCNVCGTTRPNKKFLFNHWLTHRPEKAYECEGCKTRFKQRCGFSQHQKLHHKKDAKHVKLKIHREVLNQLKKDFNTEKPFTDESEKEVVGVYNVQDQNTSKPVSLSQAKDNKCSQTADDEQNFSDGDMDDILNNLEDAINDTTVAANDGVPNAPKSPNTISWPTLCYVDFSRANVPGVTEKQPSVSRKLPENNIKPSSSGNSKLTKDNSCNEQATSSELNDNVVHNNEAIASVDYFSDAEGSPMNCYDSGMEEEKPLINSNAVSEDPFPKKLTICLLRLKEYSCNDCNVIFYCAKLYKKHKTSRVHRRVLRENRLQKYTANPEVKEETDPKEKVTRRRKPRKMTKERAKIWKKKKRDSIKLLKGVKSEEYISCPYCDEKFHSARQYRRHAVIHKKDKSCLICPQKFASVGKLVEHYINDHDGQMVVKCPICNKGYTQYTDALKDHMKYAHGDLEDPKAIQRRQRKANRTMTYKCDVCGEKCTEKSYTFHLLSHSKGEHKCIHCQQIFNIQEELENHYNEVHNGDMPFKCGDCSLKFSTNARLSLHKKENHPQQFVRDPTDMKIVCDICGARFLRKQVFIDHKKTHAPKEERRKFFCEYCGKSFLTDHSLVIHKRTHTGDTPFHCDQCEKAFISPALLKDHFDVVHSKNTTCDICGKTSSSHKNLVKHKRRMHTVQIKVGSTAFTCEHCSLGFDEERKLQKHSELHDPSRPFGCDQCSFRFKFSSNLNLHKKMVHQKTK